ncbi:hypothetical protein HDU67_009544, partial [Dinochytrium kinnereticum]
MTTPPHQTDPAIMNQTPDDTPLPIPRSRPSTTKPRPPTFYLLPTRDPTSDSSTETPSAAAGQTYFSQYVQTASLAAASSTTHTPNEKEMSVAVAIKAASEGNSVIDSTAVHYYFAKPSPGDDVDPSNVSRRGDVAVEKRLQETPGSSTGNVGMEKTLSGNRSDSVFGSDRSSMDGMAKMVRSLLPKRGVGMKEADDDRDARFNFWLGVVTVFPWLLNLRLVGSRERIARFYAWLSLTFMTGYLGAAGITFQAMSEFNWPFDSIPDGWLTQSLRWFGVAAGAAWTVAIVSAMIATFMRKRESDHLPGISISVYGS